MAQISRLSREEVAMTAPWECCDTGGAPGIKASAGNSRAQPLSNFAPIAQMSQLIKAVSY